MDRGFWRASIVVLVASAAPGIAQSAHTELRPLELAAADTGQPVDASTIIVTARKTPSSLDSDATGGAFDNQKILDTPFSVTNVDAADIANRQAFTINEVLRGDPSVTPGSNGYQNESSYVTVRGFTISGFRNNRIDDLPFYSTSSDAPIEAFERVQLLRGLSGFQYGFTAPGGIINYVMKKPTDTTQLGIDVGFMSRGLGHASADLSGPFDKDARASYRLVGVVEDGETFTKETFVRRLSGLAFVRFRPADALTLDINYLDSWRKQDGDLYGIIASAAYNIPAPLDGATRIAQPYTSYETHLRTGGARLAWTFAPSWTLTADVRHSRTDREFRDSYLTLTSSKGDYSETNANFYTYFGGNQGQLLVNGTFDTGPLKHEIVIGGSALRQEVNRAKTTPSIILGYGNLSNPGSFATIRPDANHDTFRSQNIVEKAVFAADTISLGDALKLIGGVRYSKYDQDDFAYNATTAVRSQTRAYTKKPLTPSVALVVKPAANISLYGSYVQSLEPGGTAPATAANAFVVFGPLKSKQYEIGAKAQLGAFSVTAALFRIEKGLNIPRRSGRPRPTPMSKTGSSGMTASNSSLPAHRCMVSI